MTILIMIITIIIMTTITIIVMIIVIMMKMMITLKGLILDCLQTTHYVMNCLQHGRSQDNSTVMHKIMCRTSGPKYVQNIMHYRTWRGVLAINSDRVKIAFIVQLFEWLKPLLSNLSPPSSPCTVQWGAVLPVFSCFVPTVLCMLHNCAVMCSHVCFAPEMLHGAD